MLKNIFLFTYGLENKSLEEINSFLSEIKNYLMITASEICGSTQKVELNHIHPVKFGGGGS